MNARLKRGTGGPTDRRLCEQSLDCDTRHGESRATLLRVFYSVWANRINVCTQAVIRLLTHHNYILRNRQSFFLLKIVKQYIGKPSEKTHCMFYYFVTF